MSFPLFEEIEQSNHIEVPAMLNNLEIKKEGDWEQQGDIYVCVYVCI